MSDKNMVTYEQIIGKLYVEKIRAEEIANQKDHDWMESRKQVRKLEDEIRVLKKFLTEKGLMKEFEDSEYDSNNADVDIRGW